MIYYIFNASRVAPGESQYRYSDLDTPSLWASRALRQADRVFNARHDRIYMVKDRYTGTNAEKALNEEEIAWIILSATPITDTVIG